MRHLISFLFLLVFLAACKKQATEPNKPQSPSVIAWEKTSGPLGVSCFAVSGTNLFAGTSGVGVSLSTDNGTSWSGINTGLTNTYISALAVSGTNLYAGASGSGIFRSTNNGTSWTQTTLDSVDVSSLVIIGTNVIAGTGSGGFLSSDNGISWTQTSTHSLSHFVASGTDLFAANANREPVMRSTDNGKSWFQASLDSFPVTSLAVVGTNLFAGTPWSGVFLSSDNGGIWVQTSLDSVDVSELAVIGTVLLAGTGSCEVWCYGAGVLLSADGGTMWISANTGLPQKTSVGPGGPVGSVPDVRAMIVHGKNVFASVGGEVYKGTVQ